MPFRTKKKKFATMKMVTIIIHMESWKIPSPLDKNAPRRQQPGVSSEVEEPRDVYRRGQKRKSSDGGQSIKRRQLATALIDSDVFGRKLRGILMSLQSRLGESGLEESLSLIHGQL